MANKWLTCLRVGVLAPLVVALISCGGGGGGEEREISVSIEDPTESSTYTTNSEALTLGGSASVETVSVSWSNAAVAGGEASVTAGRSWECVWPLPPLPGTCSTPATWIASIPLVVGTNDITVLASDADGNRGRDTITITRLPPTRVPDTTPPTVSSTIPANGATNFAVNYPVSAAFSEEMTSASITGTTFRLVDGSGNPVAGTVAYTSNGATFTPANSLGYLVPYTAIVAVGVKDLSGNSMAANYVWSFTTTDTPDTTPPTVTSTSPVNGADRVDPENSGVLVTFSEQIDSRSVSSSTFSLKDGSGNLVNGVIRVTNGGKSAEFLPSSALGNLMPYTAIVTTGIKDLAGNAMAADYSWTFVTEAQRFGSWQATSTAGAPSGRVFYTTAWTGGEMIVWGGATFGAAQIAGARYNPGTDTWQPISTSGAPSARVYHTGVWTGSELIVWGGYDDSSVLSSGARYNPVTDTWRPMTTSGAPSARRGHTAVWTGSEMIVWGGGSIGSPWLFNSGARYDPVTDTWQPISTSGAPSGRYLHTAVWTSSEMIVWGGSSVGGWENTGARYNPVTDTWLSTSATGAPSERANHTAVWTGSEMIVWGGGSIDTLTLNSGARYNSATDSWQPITTSGAPSARASHTGVWTGSEMIVWGGGYSGPSYENSGAGYNPATDSWQPTTKLDAPSARAFHNGVWTGSKMIVWGGQNRNQYPNSGGKFRP